MQFLKYFLNFMGAGFLAFYVYLSYVLWVLPPVGSTKAESRGLLQNRIINMGLESLWLVVGGFSVLLLITYAVQQFAEKRVNRKELCLLLAINALLVTIGHVLGAWNAWTSLNLKSIVIFRTHLMPIPRTISLLLNSLKTLHHLGGTSFRRL
jgi:hypothetical protein